MMPRPPHGVPLPQQQQQQPYGQQQGGAQPSWQNQRR
jgi:hypothetical protein